MKIRRPIFSDARKVHEMHMASIRDLCASSYSSEAIKAWSGREYREDLRINTFINDYVLVIANEESIFGYCHLKPNGYLDALYLSKDIAGNGYGKRLLHLCIAKCLDLRLGLISLDSTLNAQSFYAKFGFLNKGDKKSVSINGHNIDCQYMELSIKDGYDFK
jgi:N-acetylglutamate synthase-like GNAT family acetyltransferase